MPAIVLVRHFCLSKTIFFDYYYYFLFLHAKERYFWYSLYRDITVIFKIINLMPYLCITSVLRTYINT